MIGNRSRPLRPGSAAGAILVLALVAIAPSRAAHPIDPDALPLEVPDDPPIVSGTLIHAISPAAIVTFGAFTSIQVNVDPTGANILGDAANEPSIAVDPNDPNRMVIGWRQFDSIKSNFREAGIAYTADGGLTWTSGTLDAGVFRSDPVIAVDAEGTFFYNSLTPTSKSKSRKKAD
ncbi:MAG: hypothetical protein E6K80_14990, partial [Candidatus Eisenbacteria bacterium]